MHHRKVIATLAVSLVVGTIYFRTPELNVSAQESTVTVTDVVYDNDSLSAELRRLKTQYRGEVEEYRRLQSQYQVAKQQYQQLETLASLEAGISATQAAMESRARVLKTYLQIIKVSLIQQTGVEVDQKKTALEALDMTIAKLDTHHQVFQEQLDKVKLEQVSDDFETLNTEIENSGYRVLSLLTIGELQTVYDKSALLVIDMEVELATQGGALRQAQRQRGFDETQRRFENIRPQLQEAHGQIRDPRSSRMGTIYDQMSKDLRQPHLELTQVLAYLKELLEL